jgi:hypothetical protein
MASTGFLRDFCEDTSVIISVLLLVTSFAQTPPEAGAALTPAVPEATFNFAPPDGLHLVQKMKEYSHDRTGNAEPLVETRESVSDILWQHTPDGYTMTVTLRSMKYELDSKLYADPKARLLLRKPITYRISKSGELLAIEGYEEAVIEGVKQHIPERMQQQLIREVRPQNLEAQDRADWRRRHDKFIGKTVHQGEKWEVTDTPEPALGNLKLDSLTRFPEIHAESGRTLVTIDFQYSTVDTVRDGSSPTRTGNVPLMKVKGERVVDASTMLVVSEKISTVAVAHFSEFDDGTPINRVRTLSREYEYGPPEPAPPPAEETPPAPAPGP